MNITYEPEDFERFAEKFKDSTWGKKKTGSYFYLNSNNERTVIDPLIKELSPGSILDYGCGQHGQALNLIKSVMPNLHVQNYDPFVEEFKEEPTTTFDLVVCYNVLNAIRAKFVEAMVDDLYKLSNRYVMLNIVLFQDQPYEEDRRNREWYLKRLEPLFTVHFESLSDTVPSIIPGRGLTRKVFWLLEKKMVPLPGLEPGVL